MRSWQAIEEAAGIPVPPGVRNAVPLTDKVMVLLEMPSKYTDAGIVKPDEVVQREMGGSGWVVAVGPQAGQDLAEAAGISREEVLGLKVCFGRYSGEAFVVTDRDDEFKSRFKVVREEHIVCVLDVPTPKSK